MQIIRQLYVSLEGRVELAVKYRLTIGIAAALQSSCVVAQVTLDRADPAIIERTLPQQRAAKPGPVIPTAVAQVDFATRAPITGVVRAITIDGQDQMPVAAFAGAITPFVGQEMNAADLTRLAGAVADVGRTKGFPFATATIAAQSLVNGVLRVTLDLGRIDAVRVIGARNIVADEILARALVNGHGVRRADLERAIALVGDLPGVRVTSTRYVRQDGFGILLVTIEQDRASAYLQLDNRGSEEVGPIRSTLLASVRGLAQPADELAAIIAQTPFQPSEFTFLRGRYTASIDRAGTTMSVSASVARSNPGAALKALDVIGRSADSAASIQHPLIRGRARSLWLSAEFRASGTDQRLARQRLRRDRLTTLTGAVSGASQVAGGVARGEVTTVVGLPLAGTTREGARFASRSDGDARFVTAGYSVDWTAKLGKPFSLVMASAGQIASRPLLAAAEMGLGGPLFGRGYDYSERTGDQGIAGSVELRADVGRIPGSVITRTQFYGFVDGGVVDNLRDGIGGGSLISTGAGARLGTGSLDWLIEVAMPVNADRFDTGDRRPRISLRVARVF